MVLLVVWWSLLHFFGGGGSATSDSSVFIFSARMLNCITPKFPLPNDRHQRWKRPIRSFYPNSCQWKFASNKQDEASTPSLGRLASIIQSVHSASTFSLAFNLRSTSLFFLNPITTNKCLLSLIFFPNFNLINLFPYFSPNTPIYLISSPPTILSLFAHICYSLHDSVSLW